MKLSNDKGITMSILLITVFILMILTGITVRYVADDNNMIKTAEREKRDTEMLQEVTQNQINQLYEKLQEEPESQQQMDSDD